MTIKSLFLGSAAAFAAASAAQAADPVVVIEPVQANYVEVCDAFGAGYFYIPGTETCLNVGGYIRFQIDAQTGGNVEDTWNAWTRGQLVVSSKTDTELGALTGVIVLNSEYYSNDGSSDTYIDEAYLGLGGFQAGKFLSYWDEGLLGEIDDLAGQTNFNSMRYVYVGEGFVGGLSLDALEPSMVGLSNSGDNTPKLGVSGRVGFQAGGIGAKLDVGYDTYNEEASFRLMTSLALGPGSLDLGANYSTGWNAYANSYGNNDFQNYSLPTPTVIPGVYAEWALAAGYKLNVTDKFSITPAAQWTSAKIPGADNEDYWSAGALFDYTIVEGLSAKLNVEYTDTPDQYYADDYWAGWFRLQRDF
ncbi:MAG: porin [Martelella sp.]|uniref:porin n=1 Tax=unclassified Martelella TaxID=2629616 RepID=UPI000C3B27BF|nr:porin [Martelella sp.]MAU20857.1 porin [Martelella sp.]|tara:strand:- start:73 stop:1152 length:1080 start_codon:yes stop_codon:yes gene_type:complete